LQFALDRVFNRLHAQCGLGLEHQR
jgi:hypothetical protein